MCSLTSRDTRSPGDYLKPGEDEIEGLKRRLDDRLTPQSGMSAYGNFDESHGIGNDWEIGDVLSTWYRPNFESYMVCTDAFV
jgi:cleavage and polyadenylation specificity factor subunit 5